jgi:hypothetical protein
MSNVRVPLKLADTPEAAAAAVTAYFQTPAAVRRQRALGEWQQLERARLARALEAAEQLAHYFDSDEYHAGYGHAVNIAAAIAA